MGHVAHLVNLSVGLCQ